MKFYSFHHRMKFRSSRPEVLYEKGVLRNVAKFTGFTKFTKFQAAHATLCMQRDSGTGVLVTINYEKWIVFKNLT